MDVIIVVYQFAGVWSCFYLRLTRMIPYCFLGIVADYTSKHEQAIVHLQERQRMLHNQPHSQLTHTNMTALTIVLQLKSAGCPLGVAMSSKQCIRHLITMQPLTHVYWLLEQLVFAFVHHKLSNVCFILKNCPMEESHALSK
jgi:hypothetical protein